MGPAISVENLSFTYQRSHRPSLLKICAEIDEGRFIVLMGHGGAGKSTLCASFNGLVPRFFRGDYQGRVVVKGREVATRSVAEMSRFVGLVLQDFEAQLFSTNVELELAFGPENHCLPRKEIEARIARTLPLIGLENLRRREPATLSGGQKQRLAIGSVLTLEPEILVMDEPTTDLDPAGREAVLSLAETLRRQNRILLVVDHEPETALLADQVWLMREGELVAQGPPKEILSDPERLRACGIGPLSTVDFFKRMGWPETPLTVEEAIACMERSNLASPKPYQPSQSPHSGPKGSPVLIVEGLRFTYPRHSIEALKGIDLAIEEGEFVAILGQNGSGKTTLAKHLNGLLKPTSGRVWVRGRPTTGYRHRDLARLVGYVFQNPDHQIFARTVREEVGFGLKALGEAPGTIERRVTEALRTVGLQGYEERNPFSLTKGDRQRVAVASVLATRPDVIILDEPTTGLDYFHQKSMMEMLRGLRLKGHTIIVITHSMGVAAEYATRTIVLKEGSVFLDGETRSVFADEARLKQASLRPPPVARLSNWLGTQALTVEGIVEELKRSQGPCLDPSP
ncbi:MAG: energy-coupling factor transporter ATPase [Desulfobacterota bacterium]|nr:energy-coupling factor transporter ATPase [Thermodesulfobacteriota bacterium]